MTNYKTGQSITKALLMIFFIILSLFVIYPLVYLVSSSFTPGNSIADIDIKPFAKGFTMAHFTYIFHKTDYKIWFLNTLQVASVTTVVTMFVTALSAYVFSRFTFPLKKHLLMSLLILQIFPSFVGMIAIYVILLRVGGFDTLWGLELVYIAGNIPYNCWMVKSYLDTIPRSLDEAARIDGASHFLIFRKIIMPVARPIMIFLGITSFTGPWMDFIFPKMILRSADKQTLALGLFSFVTDKKNDFTLFSAGSLLIAIPFVIFFIFTQKAMMMSMGAAAVKE
jgi:arabinogalactan oligomer / maltooligosaccharide transport system permease protein